MAEMTPRERWLALLNKQPVDRVPTDYWAPGEVTERLLKELDCRDTNGLWRRRHIDHPAVVGPQWKRQHHLNDPIADVWGLRHTSIDYGTGSYSETSYHPLAQVASVDAVDAYFWPDARQDLDYSDIPAQLAKLDGTRPLQASGYEPF